MKKARELVTIAEYDHLETLRRCGGLYQCPKDENGNRLGPLVGYAGKYRAEDETLKQWVGDTYNNFAKVEEFPFVLQHLVEQMKNKLRPVIQEIDVFCGAPLGGYALAQMLGLVFDRRAIKAEKKITALATPVMREQSTIVFARHELRPGDEVAIVEDVCNNFSTTEKLVDLIKDSGGQTVAIICLRNGSLLINNTYTPINSGIQLPVISLIRMPIMEYKQDDPRVADDISIGNIVWKPKDEWHRLMAAMKTINNK